MPEVSTGETYSPFGWSVDDPEHAPPGSTTPGVTSPGGTSPLAPPPYLAKYGKQIEGVIAEDRAAFDEYQKKAAPAQERLAHTLESPLPKPPDQQPVKPPPDPATYRQDAMQFASAMAVLGAVAGRFTRRAGNASLNAFSAAINGWNKGNVEAYEQATKQWEEATKQTIDNNKMVLDKYKEVLENRKLNIDEQMASIQLLASQYHDKMTFDAAAAKNYTLVASIYEKNQKYTDKVQATADKLREKHAEQDEKNKANAKWLASPPGQAYIAQLPPEEQVKYRGFIEQYGSGTPRSAPAMALKQFIKEETERLGHLPSPEAITQFAAHYGSEVKATRDFGTGTQGNAIRSFSVALDHLDVAEQLGRALQNGDGRTLNMLRNEAKQQFGWEGAVDFNFAKKIVGDEITKSILGSGAGTGQDREDIQKAFNAANSPAQLEGVVRTAKRLMAGQLRGLKQQYEQTTGQHDFDSRLSEPARRELVNLGAMSQPVATSAGPPDEHSGTTSSGVTWSVKP
jgi:hypothetical protein